MARRPQKEISLAVCTHPKPVRWKVDMDYVDDLGPRERAWLSKFVAEFYGAAFSPSKRSRLHGKEGTRECYQSKNRANRDAYEIARIGNRVAVLDDACRAQAPDHGSSPTPRYLDTPEYKQARDEYRKHLSQNDRTLYPKETPAFHKAKARLEHLVEQQEDEGT